MTVDTESLKIIWNILFNSSASFSCTPFFYLSASGWVWLYQCPSNSTFFSLSFSC